MDDTIFVVTSDHGEEFLDHDVAAGVAEASVDQHLLGRANSFIDARGHHDALARRRGDANAERQNQRHRDRPSGHRAAVPGQADDRDQLAVQGAILAVMLAVLVLTLLCLLATARLMRVLGRTGINVVTRVFGIIMAALSVQFILDGLGAVWPGA